MKSYLALAASALILDQSQAYEPESFFTQGPYSYD